MSTDLLRRYTDLPSLVYLLTKKRITLLNPESWDDNNDSHYLFLYKEKKKLKSVLALCFTQAEESYHNWRVFANGPSGVCILFKRDALLSDLKNKGIRQGNVKYLTLKSLRSSTPKVDDLPFIKRRAFRDEMEYRIIYHATIKYLSTLHIPITLTCISKIILSPWLHKSPADTVASLLKSIDGCEKLEILRSTLVNNEEWKNIGGFAA